MLDTTIFISILASVITAATPLILAGIGELVTERSGVLNLGVEGMMIMGAVSGFGFFVYTHSWFLAFLGAGLIGALMALLFSFLTLKLMANQVATGLALTIFGLGLSALIGSGLIEDTVTPLPNLSLPLLEDIPFLGKLIFQHDLVVYLSLLLVIIVSFVLKKTRVGLILRAVGDCHDAAHALGYRVVTIRLSAVLFGGFCAGLAGAYLSLAYTPQWSDGMTAGRGWIALALVVFATWRPYRLLLGAWLFGGLQILQLNAQAWGFAIPSQFLSMLPYLVTVIVLVLISSNKTRIRMHTPASLGKPFYRES